MPGIAELFAPIISLLGLLHRVWDDADRQKRETITEFRTELNDFLDNLLGWHNQIVSFSSPLIVDMEQGKLPKEKRIEYLKLLETIKRVDKFYSKSRLFIKKTLGNFQRKPPFDTIVVKRVFEELEDSYSHFAERIFQHKDTIGGLLVHWNELTPKRRKWEIDRLKEYLDSIESYKKAVVLLLSIELHEK